MTFRLHAARQNVVIGKILLFIWPIIAPSLKKPAGNESLCKKNTYTYIKKKVKL